LSPVPSPVKEKKIETWGCSEELSAQCASEVSPILHRPALQYPFSGEISNSIPSPVKQIQAPSSKHIANDDEDEWKVIAKYVTYYQQAMDAHDIVDDIYRHTENFMHDSGMVMQPDYVSKPDDLYLWCLIRHSKTSWEHACPMRYSCGCGTGVLIMERKQTLTLETIGVHDQHSHKGGKIHARKSVPGVGVFSRPENEGSANDESCWCSTWWSTIIFCFIDV
jgi:hypothetical protein